MSAATVGGHPARRLRMFARLPRPGPARLATLAAMATLLLGSPAGLAGQNEQVLAALTGETGIDPEPGTLLATVSRLSVEQASLADALARLAESSRVQIAFSPTLLPGGLRVDCDCMTLHVAQTLDRLLTDTELGYVELGSQVIIVPKAFRGLPDGVLRGRVRSEVAIPLEDATVRLRPAADTTTRRLTGTDRLGFFTFHDLLPGRYSLSIGLIGYALHEQTVEIRQGADLELEVTLAEQAVELEGVLAEARRSRQRERFERSGGATVQEFNARELKAIPGIAESDAIKSVEVLPGVTRVSDFSAAFNVRGGSADQNLILLDGVPIFNPFHAMGLFSVFNADMVRRAELHSGGFPAEYGGRTSSVLLVESDLGDGDFGVDAGLSLLASRAAVQGGLSQGVKDRLGLANARWRVSGRRSYLDLLTRPFMDASLPYTLMDFQAGFEAWTKHGDRIRITGYSGGDLVDLRTLAILNGSADPEDIPEIDWSWGNDAIGGSWTRPMRGGGALDVHGSFSRFQGTFDFDQFENIRVRTGISESTVGVDLSRRPTGRLNWKSGWAVKRAAHDNVIEGGVPEMFPVGREAGNGSAIYSQLQWKANARWLLEGGLRLDHWQPDEADATTVISPRFAVKHYFRDGDWALRAAAGRYSQSILSMRDEKLPFSPDWWMSSGSKAPVVVSDHIQGGIEAVAGSHDEWFVALEGYYRRFDGLSVRNWADDPEDPDDDLLVGEGRSYGTDVIVRRDVGETTGWLSVSFLKARRTFPDTGAGLEAAPIIEYPPVFDRRLDVDLVLRRALPLEIEAGLRWNFGTGLPYTRPLGAFKIYRAQMIDLLVDPTYATGIVYGPRNGERYPVRHRMDISFRKTWEKGWGRITPHVSIVNVYNRKNVLFYSFNFRPEVTVRTGSSMIPILPTIGVEVSFR